MVFFKKFVKVLARLNIFKKKPRDGEKRGKKNIQPQTRVEEEEIPLNQKVISPQEVTVEKVGVEVEVGLVDSSFEKLQMAVQMKTEEGDMTSDGNVEEQINAVLQKVLAIVEGANETTTGQTGEEVTVENIEVEVEVSLVDSNFDKLQIAVQMKTEEGDMMSGGIVEEQNNPVLEALVLAIVEGANETTTGQTDAKEKDDIKGRAEEKVAMENMVEAGDTTSMPEEDVEDDVEKKDDVKGRAEEKVAMENMVEAGDTTSIPEEDKEDDAKEKDDIKGRAEEKVAMENMVEAGDTTSIPEEDKEDVAKEKDDIKGRIEELSEQLVVKTKENTDLMDRLSVMEKQLKELKIEREVKEKESTAELERLSKKIDVVKSTNRLLRLKKMEMGKKLVLTEEQLEENVKLSSAKMGMLSSAMENFRKDWDEDKKKLGGLNPL